MPHVLVFTKTFSFEAEGIAAKWSTGKVWEHPNFADCIGMEKPQWRGLSHYFYGYSDEKLSTRPLIDLSEQLKIIQDDDVMNDRSFSFSIDQDQQCFMFNSFGDSAK